MDKRVDKNIILANLDQMIGVLEYDSMRSAGKAKMNAPQILAMKQLADLYTEELTVAPTVKSAPAKKEG